MKIEAAQRLKADWWSALGKQGQERYIEEHPRSKKAKEQFEKESEKRPTDDKSSTSHESKIALTGKQIHKILKHTFTQEEAYGLKHYSSDASKPELYRYRPLYQVINQSLRSGDKLSKEATDITKILDKAFSTSSTTEPIKVFRGIS